MAYSGLFTPLRLSEMPCFEVKNLEMLYSKRKSRGTIADTPTTSTFGVLILLLLCERLCMATTSSIVEIGYALLD